LTEHGLISTDHNDPSTRKDFSIELTTAFEAIFKRMATLEETGMMAEEAITLWVGMLREAEGGKAYL
jgi:hypothetical protein